MKPDLVSTHQLASLCSKILDFLSPYKNLEEFSVTDSVCHQAIFFFPIRNVSAAAPNGPNQKVRDDVEHFHLYSYTNLMTCHLQQGARACEEPRFRKEQVVCVCAIFLNTCRMLVLKNNVPGYYAVANYTFSSDQFLLLV